MSKRNCVLPERGEQIIVKLDKYFQSEREHATQLINDLKTTAVMCGPEGAITMDNDIYRTIIQTLQNKNKVTERIRSAIGINPNTLIRIRRESKQAQASGSKMITPKKKPRGKRITCDVFEITALNSVINSFYTVKGEIPSIKKISNAAKEDLDFPGSKETMRRIMINSLGYTSKKCLNNTVVLAERFSIKAWRSRYLRRIRQNDALGTCKKPVIYIGETWIHAHYTVKKCWQPNIITRDKNNEDIARNGWILVHAGGENGFVEGALLMYKCKLKTRNFRDEMNATDFAKWVNLCLLPKLPENAIIVMDNAPYHSMDASNIPNMSTVKTEMQSWLKNNNIAYEEEFTKAELYELIKKHKPPKMDAIDNIFTMHGFEVLRLPPFNCDLNPMEYIWPLVKRRVADKNVSQLESKVERLTLEAIASITSDDWKNVISQVKETEDVYRQREIIEDDDKFISQCGGSSSDDDDGDSSNSDGEMSGIEAQSD